MTAQIRHWVWVSEIDRCLRVVTLAELPSVDSDEVADGVVHDCDAQGALVGIDVQHASQRADIRRLAVNHMPLDSLEAA